MGKTEEDFIGTKAAAKKRGCSPRQVRNWIDEGILPAKRIGRDYLILPSDLENVPFRKRGPQPKAKGSK